MLAVQLFKIQMRETLGAFSSSGSPYRRRLRLIIGCQSSLSAHISRPTSAEPTIGDVDTSTEPPPYAPQGLYSYIPHWHSTTTC